MNNNNINIINIKLDDGMVTDGMFMMYIMYRYEDECEYVYEYENEYVHEHVNIYVVI